MGWTGGTHEHLTPKDIATGPRGKSITTYMNTKIVLLQVKRLKCLVCRQYNTIWLTHGTIHNPVPHIGCTVQCSLPK